MKKRGLICLALVLVMVTALFAGCRGQQNVSSTAPSDTPAVTESAKTTEVQPSETETVPETEAPTVPESTADPEEDRDEAEVRAALEENYPGLVLVTETNALNVRRDPTTDSPVIGVLPGLGGAMGLMVTGPASDGWVHVQTGRLTGYVSAGFVTAGKEAYDLAVDAAKKRIRVIVEKANLRQEPSLDAEILDVVPEGTVFNILSVKDGFYEVPFLTGTAFIADVCVNESYYLEEALPVDVPEEPSEQAEPPAGDPTDAPPETLPPAPPETAAPQPPETQPSQGTGGLAPQQIVTGWNGHSVCIDAGHQSHGIPEQEPNGPGSSTMKAKLTTGTSGCVTGAAEHVVNLQVALKLRDVLASRGYTVVMIRTSADCPLSNAERAIVSNESGAEIFLRLHCNGVDSQSTTGVINYAPAEDNPYMSADVIRKSIELSAIEAQHMCAATGAKNLGVLKENTMSGINWSKIPVTILEMGFMSNPDEDRLLSSDSYQQQMAEGIANGVDAYFASH